MSIKCCPKKVKTVHEVRMQGSIMVPDSLPGGAIQQKVPVIRSASCQHMALGYRADVIQRRQHLEESLCVIAAQNHIFDALLCTHCTTY